MIDDKQLISQLLASDLIDQKSLREGLELAEKRDRTLYDVLIFEDLVDEHSVVTIASTILNVPCVALDDSEIDRETAQIIPAALATSSQSLPLELSEDDGVQVLKLAMTDPIDVMAMDEIASHTGVDIRPVLVGPADLQQAIEKLYGGKSKEEGDALELDEVVSDGDIFELSDEDLTTNEAHDFDEGPELVNAPGAMVSDEDSWAAMFDDDEEQESSPQTGDTGVISQEMRDRPPTGVLEVMEEDLDDDEVYGGGNPAFSQHPAMFDTDESGTQIGTPAELGDWELDEALEDSQAGELDDESADDDDSIGGTQLGTPVDPDEWELDDGFYDDEKEDARDQTSIGLATRGDLDLASLGLAEEDESDEDAPDEDVPDEDTPDEDTESGSADETDDGNDSDSEEISKKPKRRVPSTIRDALKKVSERQKKSKQERPPENEEKTSDDQDTDDQDESNEKPAALGRIEVKKVAIPTFKGAVEKRSDRAQTSDKASKTVAVDIADADESPQPQQAPPTTREISASDLMHLTAAGGDDDLELPDDLDTAALLRGLIRLLIASDVISRDEVDALIKELS